MNFQRSGIFRCIRSMLRKKSALAHILCILVFSIPLVIIIGRFILPIEIDIKGIDLTEQYKCPACFGDNLCSDIYTGNLRLSNWTRFTISKLVNARNVYHGMLSGKKVMVKKLGHDFQSKLLDDSICKMADKPPSYCNPAHYIKFLTTLFTMEHFDRPGGGPNGRQVSASR